ncbi:MAG: hypothetical protein ACI4SS_01170, partial [Clostridia bacterium]
MFRQFADIVFTEDVVKDLPKAVYRDIEIDGTDEHRQIQQQISDVLSNTPKTELLRVHGQLMSMADAASVDLRMLSGAESQYNLFKDRSMEELDYSDSKINTMCNYVYEEYKASDNIKGTQIIFCDKGSGSGKVYSFSLHKDIMQKLAERGIPKDQIVIVKDQNDAQLEALYEKVNDGEVRVLIGTSQKMAEGLNVQKRVVAIHHPTVTYKPSDWEQGNARGVRAGNINKEVRIYRYLQGNTFDSHKWQAQDRKGEMIRKALRGEDVAELEDIGADDDGGAGIDAATAMAITSGNPLVKEKIDIDKEVARLRNLKQNYMKEVYRYQDAIAKNPGLIGQYTEFANKMEKDIALRDKYGDKAVISIRGKIFEKQTEANKALSEAIKAAPKNGKYTRLGEYNGFNIMFKGDTGGMNYSLILKGSNEYTVEYAGNGNNIARIAGVLKRLTDDRKKLLGRIEQLKSDLVFARQEVNKPFEKEGDLAEAITKQKDITYRYEHYSENKNVSGRNNDGDSENRYFKIAKPVSSSFSESKNSAQAEKGIGGLEPYSQKQIDDWKGGKNIVLFNSEEQFQNFVDEALNNVNMQEKLYFGKIGKSTAKRIFDKTGLNVLDFNLALHKYEIKKILSNSHGNESKENLRGQRAITQKDLLRIPEIVTNPDDFSLSGTYEGKPVIKFSKNIGGESYVVTYVSSKHHDLAIQTMYAQKNKSLATAADAKSPALTSKTTSGTALDNSITQPTEDVKGKNSDNKYSRRAPAGNTDGWEEVKRNSDADTKSEGKNETLEKVAERISGLTGISIGKKQNKTLGQIVEHISELIGVPIGRGKIGNRNAAGVYKEWAKVIRADANALDTISHELGHWADDEADLSDSSYIEEAIGIMSKDFKEQYENVEIPGEAVGEFMKLYLQNKDAARKQAPNFYNDFRSRLESAGQLGNVEEMADEINGYLSTEAEKRLENLAVGKKDEPKPKLKERLDNAEQAFVEAFADCFARIEAIQRRSGIVPVIGEKDAYIMATNSLNSRSKAQYILTEAFVDKNGNRVGKSFIECFEGLDTRGLGKGKLNPVMRKLEDYLICRHAPERIEGKDGSYKQVFADPTLENPELLRAKIAELEKRFPSFPKVAENL